MFVYRRYICRSPHLCRLLNRLQIRICWQILTVFLSLFGRYQVCVVYYNCMFCNVRKLISPPFQCTSITNRVLSLFDRFTAYYNCMTWNVRKLISPPYQCTNITNRVLSWFDRFISHYKCRTRNDTELISPPFQCTSITNRVLSLFKRFTSLLQLYELKSKKTPISVISVHKNHKSFSWLILTALPLITTVWVEISETSHLRDLSAQVSQIVFLAYLTVLRLITTVWPEMSENSYLRYFSAKVSQIVFLAYLTVLRLITTIWPEMSENS